MKTRISSATGLLIMAVALAACGGTAGTRATPAPIQSSAPVSSNTAPRTAAPAQASAGVSSGQTIDACALITEKEATALLGTDPGPGLNSGTATEPACAYDASLTIGITLADGKAQFDQMRPAPGSANLQTISGVGDGAYATIVANTIAAMEILKGSTLVSINIQGNPTAQNITVAALTALGTTVVGRLSAGAASGPATSAHDAATAAPAAGSACALVTVAEVEAITGQPMAVSGDARPICAFAATADASLTFFVQIYNDKPSMSLMLQIESGSDHLPGLGDDAFWNGALGDVFVQRGARAFSLTFNSLANLTSHPAAIKTSMVDLATKALTRF